MFTDISPMQWGGYNLNVAAGIEDILIKTMKPEWNRAEFSKKLTNTHGEYEDLEIHLQRLVSLQLKHFHSIVSKSLWVTPITKVLKVL